MDEQFSPLPPLLSWKIKFIYTFFNFTLIFECCLKGGFKVAVSLWWQMGISFSVIHSETKKESERIESLCWIFNISHMCCIYGFFLCLYGFKVVLIQSRQIFSLEFVGYRIYSFRTKRDRKMGHFFILDFRHLFKQHFLFPSYSK